MRSFLLVAALCLSSVFCNARIVYISPAGNNSNSGTITAPWKTLAYAASVAKTRGDIIHILPGNYTESSPAFLAVGVSIEGEGVTSNIISTYTGGAAIELSSNTDGTNGNQSVSFIKLDGNNLTGRQGILVQSRSNVKIHDCTIQDFLGDGVLFKGAIWGGQPTVYATGNELYNCIITNNSDRAYGQGNIVATGYRGMLIHDNIITQMSRPLGSNGNSYSATAEGYSEGLKFYNNKSYRNSSDENQWSFHLEMWNSQGGMEIYNNEFHNGSQMIDWAGEENGTGIIPGSYAYAAYVHDNLFQFDEPKTTSTGYQDIGVNIEGNIDGIIISNNHFKNMPYGVQMTGANSTTFLRNITIKNNLFDNGGYVNAEWGFDIDILTHCDMTAPAHCVPITGIQILNNTFITNSLSALFVYMNAGTTVSDVQFTNNIVKGVRSYGFMTIMESAGVKNNWTVKNNLLYQNANGNNVSLQHGATLPEGWNYSGNFVANPLLDASFYLQTGSPAINAGTYVGLPYFGTAPDVGAFEKDAIVVPIILQEFTATAKADKTALLKWKTSTEINSDYFVIERSADGVNFSQMAIVNANDNSNNIINYEFTDFLPGKNLNFYRLKMVDNDGNFKYSNIAVVSFKSTVNGNISILTNNADQHHFEINLTSGKTQQANYVIYDATGRMLCSSKITLQSGVNNISKNISLPGGVYYFRMETSDEKISLPMISRN